jgi:alginate O-acetyltransferase complex protein AlgI
MLFHSYPFLFVFLPGTLLLYWVLCHLHFVLAARILLLGCSLLFYAWWNPLQLPLLLGSMAVNYAIGHKLRKQEPAPPSRRKQWLIAGIAFNVGLLGLFKYAAFTAMTWNSLIPWKLPVFSLALPLAISFFTFQQIAYLVDTYRGDIKHYGPVVYGLFVTFFPHLIAGPLVHHKEMMPQFAGLRTKVLQYRNMACGLFVFVLGLVKKVLIADTFATWATAGFDHTSSLSFGQAWLASLSYTMQIYFDFSGYTDMAVGAALMFNIKLPSNFLSPYKSLSVTEFWRRWHITLSRWLFAYVYVPLGGSKQEEWRTYVNLFIVFLLSGLWHGAGWTFVLWGALHGGAVAIHRGWRRLGLTMGKRLAWILTFLFVNAAWVLFRAKSWADAEKVLKGMIGQGTGAANGTGIGFATFLWVVGSLLVVTLARNSVERQSSFRPDARTAIALAILFAVITLSFHRMSEFLYYNF